jgi:hypothetical protein
VSIDIYAGMRHAAQLLEAGAEIESLMGSVPFWPAKFAYGVLKVITNEAVVEEVQSVRAGKYNPPQNPWPETESVPLGPELPKNVKHSPYSRPGNPYPGLNEFHRKGKFSGWQVRRTQNRVEYRSRIFKDYADAIAEWKRMDAMLAEEALAFAESSVDVLLAELNRK